VARPPPVAVLTVVAAVAAMIPGVLTSGYMLMNTPALASQEWTHVRPAVQTVLGRPGATVGSSNGIFEADRAIAAYLDAQRLPEADDAAPPGALAPASARHTQRNPSSRAVLRSTGRSNTSRTARGSVILAVSRSSEGRAADRGCRSNDASCSLGLKGLAVERVVLTDLGVRIVQVVTDDPGGVLSVIRGGVELGGLGADPPA